MPQEYSKEFWSGHIGRSFLSFQKVFVFVGGSPADVAHSRQFADVELSVFVGGVVAQEGGGDVLFAYLRPPDLLSSLHTQASSEKLSCPDLQVG